MHIVIETGCCPGLGSRSLLPRGLVTDERKFLIDTHVVVTAVPAKSARNSVRISTAPLCVRAMMRAGPSHSNRPKWVSKCVSSFSKEDPEKRKRWRPSVRPSLHPHSLRQLLLSLFVCVFLCVCLCGSGLAGAARETQFHSHSPSLSHPQPHPKKASDEIYCRTHQTWRNNTDPAEETRIDAAADRPPYQTRQSKKSPNRAYLRDVTLHHKR